jgi:RNA polymerase sporulation-specific sigma factor
MAYLCKVEICGVDTSKLPILNSEQMLVLFRQYQNGNKDAREQLIYGNLRLVLSVIQRFSNRNENADDLFQVGCIGLMKAIDNFDLKFEVRFSTYAVPMILGEVRRYLRDNTPMRVSRSLRDIAYKALQIREYLTAQLGKEPGIDQIAKELELPIEEVCAALDAIQEPVSLYDPIYNDGGDPIYIMDQVKDTKNTDFHWLENIAIQQALDRLSPREQCIIDMRFFQGKTQMEVADEIAISQAQVSRLEKGALQSMRKYV